MSYFLQASNISMVILVGIIIFGVVLIIGRERIKKMGANSSGLATKEDIQDIKKQLEDLKKQKEG